LRGLEASRRGIPICVLEQSSDAEILSLSARFYRIAFWQSSNESPLTFDTIARDPDIKGNG
jgi:hypothetical protein